MAKLCGFELKNYKSFKGHEGEPLVQGDVWFNGKKLGFWSQDGWGGMDHFDFDTSAFDEKIGLLAGTDIFPAYTGGYTPDLSVLLARLADLKDTEKVYKKYAKKGIEVMIGADDGWQGIYYPTKLHSDSDKRLVEAAISAVRERASKDLGVDKSEVNTAVYKGDSFTVGSPIIVNRKLVKGISDECRARDRKFREAFSNM